jgi:hypothetical protein
MWSFNFLHECFHGYTLRALFVNSVYIQDEHKVFPWLQTFITRKLRGIKIYFLWKWVGSDLYILYGRTEALNIVQVWKWKLCNYLGGISMPGICTFCTAELKHLILSKCENGSYVITWVVSQCLAFVISLYLCVCGFSVPSIDYSF